MCAFDSSDRTSDRRRTRGASSASSDVARFAIADLLVAAEPMDEVRAVLDRAGLARIGDQLEEIAGNNDPRDRAWAYRRIIDSLFAAMRDGTMTMTTAKAMITTATTTRSRPSHTLSPMATGSPLRQRCTPIDPSAQVHRRML